MKTCLRSAFFLGIMFTLGLSLGYILHTSPGYNMYMYNAPAVRTLNEPPIPVPKTVEHSNADVGSYARLPRQQKETNGVVYDCVTWKILYTYDGNAVEREYRVFPEMNDTAEADEHRQASFVEIFHKQTWGGRQAGVSRTDQNYKASGPGSALERSQGVIAILHTMIDRLKTQLNKTTIKILDLPCGDLQYMSHFLNTRTDIDYTGVDIVPELIEKHKANYKDKNHIHFKQMDIVKDKLEESYDLINCRMMLQHLLNKDVLKTLYHFSSSKSSYLATTTFQDHKSNKEVGTEGIRFRLLNLEKAPVNLSPPICTYREPVHSEHFMAIWRLPLLRHI